MTGLSLRADGDILALSLDRPDKGNALSVELVEAMHKALDEYAQACRLLIIRSSGKHFCTGFDLSDLDKTTDAALLHRFVRIETLFQRLGSLACATLAIGHGRIIGAGADLFVTCDARVIVNDAQLSFPGAGFGIVLGTHRLTAIVGASKALDIVRSGGRVSAVQALELGLATHRLDGADLDAVIERETIAARRLDLETMAAIRRATSSGADDSVLAALVRSASRPGLRERISDYRSSQLKAR